MAPQRVPYPYQRRVLKALLEEQKPVVLQAPTGAGKTSAALWPFLHAFRHDVDIPFPAQAIYSVPMRVLANQFIKEYRALTENLQRRENLTLSIQTGEQPSDPELLADLVFATVDQTLSSLLGVPYSLSRSRSNLNVGAIVGSYLVFDEFHLFPYEATRTLFHLLRHLRPLVPFVLMTATFSRAMLEELGAVLHAHVEVVPPAEALAIASRDGQPPKQRRFHVRPAPLLESAGEVLDRHSQRTLAVLNTVERAQTLYRQLVERGARPVPFQAWVSDDVYQSIARASDPQTAARPWLRQLRERLLAHPGPWVMLLHSRFTRGHRLLKEFLLQDLWGYEGLQAEQPSLIVVATQVVEVGLDISAQVLHTELAPAAAVLQRAGRCARYPDEQGEVHVYPVPPDRQGKPNYRPYGQSRIEQATVEASWQALQARDGAVVDFREERAIIDEAHTAQDQALLRDLTEAKSHTWEQITTTLTGGETGLRTQLIRDTLSSRTVLVYDAPAAAHEPPFGLEGFSLHIGVLHGKLPTLLALQEELDLDWALLRLHTVEDDGEVGFQWLDVRGKEDLEGAFLLAVHPRLVAYDAEQGFRLGEVSDGAYQAQRLSRPKSDEPDYGAYRLECYHEHIAAMRQVFERGPWKRRFAWPAARLARILEVPEEQVWQALYLTLALHDVGKLQKEWQAWAWEYQRRIGQPLPADHCLVAHTYSDRSEAHKQAARRARPKKPNHAGEGAHASGPLTCEALEDEFLAQAVVTAIARHHSPWVEHAQAYRLHSRAGATLGRALQVVDLPAAWAEHLRPASDAPDLAAWLLEWPEPRETDELWWGWWLYFLLVRNLRLLDGMAVEEVLSHRGTESTKEI